MTKATQQVVVNEAMAIEIAAQRSLEKPETIQWLQVTWDGEGSRKRAVQWIGLHAGNRVAAITWVRRFGRRPAGYLLYVMRRPIGTFHQLAPAQYEAGHMLMDVAEGLVDLFTTWAAHYDAWRKEMEPIAEDLGLTIWGLGQWAAETYERHLTESQAAIEASRAQIEAFNAKFSVKKRASK